MSIETAKYRAPTDFKRDAGERLLEVAGTVPSTKRLVPALKLAGEQLEWLKPGVMGAGKTGIYGGPVVALPRRSVVFLVADSRRVAAGSVAFHADCAAEDMFRRSDAIIAAGGGEEDTGLEFPVVMNGLLDRFGAKPNSRKLQVAGDAMETMIAVLFARLPAPNRITLGHVIDGCLAHDVCPALVGAGGPASSGRRGYYSGVWPLLIPLAPYLDAVLPPEEYA